MSPEGSALRVADLLREARQTLARSTFDVSMREANLLLGHVLELSEASLLTRPERHVPRDLAEGFRALVHRRRQGEPVAYLVGEREFYGRPFFVDSRVLIPRPETEHLVEAALALDLPERSRILDVGTGSGCLAVTLALEMGTAEVIATDISLPALQVARANVERYALGRRVWPVQANLTATLRLDQFDLVLSNPPYIDIEDLSTAAGVRAFEPPLALFAERRGKEILAKLLVSARRLRPDAHLQLEIGYDQSEWIGEMVAQRSELTRVEIVRDYGGIPRTAIIRRTEETRHALSADR